MKWRGLPIVAFDTETTGLMPFGGDRMIEFAAVVLRTDDEGRVTSQEDHSFLINPQMPIPRVATQITGITDADVAGAPAFAAVADEIRVLLDGAITIAHNYPFDLAFITTEFGRMDQPPPVPLAEIDTVDLSMKVFPDARSHKLEDVCKRLSVVLDGAHRATNDAAACGRSFIEMYRRTVVADDLQEMLDWASAIGRPPTGSPFGPDEIGAVVFNEGPHTGEPVAKHPIHLAWMEKARSRGPHGWQFRYSENARRWIRRWLNVRGSGRAKQNPKSFRNEDWVLDSCIADKRADL